MLIKQFVQESISHAIRLEQALVKLQTERRIVVLHYSPIRATLQGEDPEIYAFLGSSRLEEPINRFRATGVFHGHAHNGITDGKLQLAFPFTTSQRLCCIKPESPTASSNCKAPTTRGQIKDPPATRPDFTF
jgi:hypothetical protein